MRPRFDARRKTTTKRQPERNWGIRLYEHERWVRVDRGVAMEAFQMGYWVMLWKDCQIENDERDLKKSRNMLTRGLARFPGRTPAHKRKDGKVEPGFKVPK